MDFSHYSGEPTSLAVDLVNTHDAHTGHDHLGGIADLQRFIGEHGDIPQWRVAESDLVEIRALRDRLRWVFGASSADEAAALLNEILIDVAAVPRVSTHSGDPHLHIEPLDETPARWLGATTAMGLGVTLIETGLDRFGSCASTSCDDVFVDTSRNRSRRNCSDTCTTRENVAAHRRRLRET
jgi:predicted RNA-binding Zn ribbon-like protein